MTDPDPDEMEDRLTVEDDEAEEVLRNFLHHYIEQKVGTHEDVNVEEILGRIDDPDLIDSLAWGREMSRVRQTLKGFSKDVLVDIISEEMEAEGLLDSEETRTALRI